MDLLIWMVVAYAAGSMVTFYIARKGILELAIEATLTGLIKDGFLRTKQNKDGELEIVKWHEDPDNA